MPIMEISIVPVGTGSASVSRYVSEIIKVLQAEKNIEYTLTAMGTIISSESLDCLFKTAKKMHNVLLKNKSINRVVTSIKIDDRKDKKLTIAGKIKSVSEKLK